MEVWHFEYHAIISMPSSIRYRLILQKIALEKKRNPK